MQISVKGKQMDVGDALRDHVTSALDALVNKYFGQPIDATVVFSRQAHMFRADISAHPARGLTVQGFGAGTDAYGAFEGASEKIEKQLRRYKTRLKHHKGKGEDKDGVLAAQYSVIASDEASEEEAPAEEAHPTIVAEMQADIPVCTVSGAVMRLDLSGNPAMMFRNSGSGRLNMIYRRADGNIGWVDPEQMA